MPVAVRLVEILTLITALGILTAFSIFVVTAERVLTMALLLFRPLAHICTCLLNQMEQVLLWVLGRILSLTGGVGGGMTCSSYK